MPVSVHAFCLSSRRATVRIHADGTLAVPGLKVVSIGWEERVPGERALLIRQVLSPGDTLELRYLGLLLGTDPEPRRALRTLIAVITGEIKQRERCRADIRAQIAELSPSLFLYDQLQKHAVADYVDWKPEDNSSVMGYQIYAPWIGVAP